MFGPSTSVGKTDSSSCMFGRVVAMSTLVVFGRKMIFIDHKLGQLVIIDLLCFGGCCHRFDLFFSLAHLKLI